MMAMSVGKRERMKQLRSAMATPPVSAWPHWENQLAKARREGVIEGLERAERKLDGTEAINNAAMVREYMRQTIRSEIKRLRAEQKEG